MIKIIYALCLINISLFKVKGNILGFIIFYMKTREERFDSFQYWLMDMRDAIGRMRDALPKEISEKLDYSIESLDILEQYQQLMRLPLNEKHILSFNISHREYRPSNRTFYFRCFKVLSKK